MSQDGYSARSTVSYRRILSVFAVLVAIVASSLSPLFSNPAYADTASDLNAINTKYYSALYLRDCLSQLGSAGNQIPDSLVQAWSFLVPATGGSNHTVAIGQTLVPDSGVAQCSSTQLAQSAVQAVGYQNGADFLLAIGYQKKTIQQQVPDPNCTATNTTYCQNITQNTLVYVISGANTISSTVVSKYPQSNIAKYVAYLAIFNAHCSLTEPPTGKGTAVTYKKVTLGSDGRYSAVDTKAEFPITTTTVPDNNYGGSTTVSTKTADTAINNFDYNGQNTTCAGLLSKLDSLVGYVVLYDNAHLADPINTTIKPATTSVDCKANPNDPSCQSSTPTCTVEGIGWIVCPVANFLGHIADGAESVLNTFFIINTPKLFSTTNDTYKAWQQMLQYANIIFIIAFVIIIFSQVTSFGVSNYGIKKLLPKLLVVALLVNVSYYLCALAVDVSNVIGVSIANTISTSIKYPIQNATSDSSLFNGTNTFTNLVGTALVITAGAIAAYFMLATVIGVIFTLVIVAVTMVILLAIRQGLVVLLVVVSPLAFAAMLLPNTAGFYKKWFNIFKDLLLVFPIASALYGAGVLAGTIIAKSSSYWLLQLIGAALPTLMLIAVYKVFTNAMHGLEAVGGFVRGASNGVSKAGNSAGGGALAGLKKRDQETRQIFGGGLKRRFGGRLIKAEGRREAHLGAQKAELDALKYNSQLNDPKSAAYAARELAATNNANAAKNQIGTNASIATRGTAAGMASFENKEASEKAAKIEEATVDTMIIRNGNIQAIDQQLRATNMQKNLAETEENAEWESRVATEGPLTYVANQTRAHSEAESSAKRVQTANYADAIQNDQSLAQLAGGVDQYGQQRATANAIASDAHELSEAVKNIEIAADTSSGITGYKAQYEQAVHNGDVASARAYQNLLLKSGAPGIAAWKDSTNSLQAANAFASPDGKHVEEMIKTNIVNNHGGMKGVDNAIMEWALKIKPDPATGQQPPTLKEQTENIATYSKLTNREIIGSKGHVQINAIRSGAIDQKRATDIMRDRDFNSMAENIKAAITEIARSGQVPPAFLNDPKNAFK